MKKLISILTALLAVIALGGMTVNATNMIPENEIIEKLWDNIWYGHGDDGTTFPEASYEYYLLSDWVSSNYGSPDYDWTNLGHLRYSYSDYYDNLTDQWIYEDDEEGNWFITDENGETYHFELIQGQWNKIDSNGNTVETFSPHSTLEEDVAIAEPSGNQDGNVYDDGDDADSGRVTPDNADATHQKASEWVDQVVQTTTGTYIMGSQPVESGTTIAADQQIPEQENTSTLPYVGTGLAGAVIGSLITYFLTAKKKNRN